MSYQKGFFHRKVVLFSGYFWVFLSKLTHTLFWVFAKIFLRHYSSKAMNSACSSDFPNENHQTEPKTETLADFSESFEDNGLLKSENFGTLADTSLHESNQIDSEGFEPETEAGDFGNFGLEEEEEGETSKLVFKFQYQSWNCNCDEEESKESNGESCDFAKRDTVSVSANKYQFFSGYSFRHILDEPEEASNFTVEELYVHPNHDSPLESQVLDDFEGGVVNAEIHDNTAVRLFSRDLEAVDSNPENNFSACEGKTESIVPPQTLLNGSIVEPVIEDNLLSEDDDFICSSIDSDSIRSIGDGFLSETDFGAAIDNDILDTLRNHGDEKNRGLTDKNLVFENFDVGYEPEEEDEDIIHELRKLEQDSSVKEKGRSNSDSLTSFDAAEDSNRFDTLWEHQELIEQLKMELKKVRATGLPTILEDSESPRIMEDLKPWKIDNEKLQQHDANELPKFYRSYRERMRKFDILNYQKMYAMGFLESKEPLQSFSSLKKASSQATITSILQHNFVRRKNIVESDPMKKFKRELHCDLESIYVGQLCLSWEFLHWEYDKSLELWESDQYGMRMFNEVAGEFQQFQVLLQRFIENEAFQGPRVQNYTKNRCLMRNLLQVPLIREDTGKDKKKVRQNEVDEDAITSEMLVEILEESIRTIWRFIRADKDASSSSLTRETQVELQDPADSQLLLEIRTDLQKKEKRLRNLLRSGSCILKKFKKHDDEDETDQVLYFFSQVDMKLVWRVLNMSKITTDHLAWCRSKLKKITFVNRRIHVEPSFLLFPS